MKFIIIAKCPICSTTSTRLDVLAPHICCPLNDPDNRAAAAHIDVNKAAVLK